MKKKEILRLKQVLERVPFSRPTIDRLERRDQFPKRRHVGRIVFWIEEEIEAYLASLAAQEKAGDPRGQAVSA